MTTHSVLNTADKIGCLQFLYKLQKKLVGSADPNRRISPCIKIKDVEAEHRGLLAYQIANLLFNGPLEQGMVNSHICCHEQKGDSPQHASPGINPLHMQQATIQGNKGRDAHQLELVDFLIHNRVKLGKDKFSGPIYFKYSDNSRTEGTGFAGPYKKAMKSFCHYDGPVGDTCFLNFREIQPNAQGFGMFPVELQQLIHKKGLQPLVDRVIAQFSQN